MKIFAMVDGTTIGGVLRSRGDGEDFRLCPKIHQGLAGGVNRVAGWQGLRGAGGVEDDENLLRAEPPGIGEEAGAAGLLHWLTCVPSDRAG